MKKPLLLILSVTLGMVVLAPPAGAAFPGGNGRLTFTSWSKVWTAQADGSDKTEILERRRRPIGPQWSPDGTRIAYECGGQYADICVMRADGSHNRRVTDSPEQHDGEVAWAPGGRRLIFVRNATLIVLNLRSRDERTLTTELINPHSPSWSPDGDQIAVMASRSQQLVGYPATDIYVMDADGSNVTNLTNDTEYESGVDWSPTGEELVFSGQVEDNEGAWTLQIIAADGSSRREVSPGSVFAVSPSWSPNGRRIAFSGYDDVGPNSALNGYRSIYTVRVNGSGMRNLFPHNKRGYYSPDWQPR